MPDGAGIAPKQGAAGFALVFVGGGNPAGLEMVVIERSDQVVVEVISTRCQPAGELLIELRYDDTEYSPLSAQATDAIAPAAESLCLQVLDVPGVVSLGQVPIASTKASIPLGSVLARVLFDRKPFTRERVRQAADVPTHSAALSPLTWDEESGEFMWYYVNPGDYDQNGLVDIVDITALGREFGATGPFSFFSVLSVIDGNGNGEISVSDLSVIGLYWGNLIEGYNFYGSEDIGSVPSGYGELSTIEPLANVSMSEARGNPALDRLWFSYTPEPEEAEFICWVRPVAGSAEGTPSEGTRSNVNGTVLNTPPPIDPGEGGEGFNLAPEAVLTLEYTGTNVPLAVSFDASASSDEDGEIVFFEWDFEGDGLFDSFSSMPTATHTYVYPGTYAPFVRVTDDGGAWDVFQVPEFTLTELEVANIPPVADLVTTITAGEAPVYVGLIASGSVDLDGWIEKYEWDYNGDGEFEFDSGADSTVMPLYETPGSYIPVVRVTDNQGASATAAAAVPLLITAPPEPNAPPVAVLSVGPGGEGGDAPHTVHFDAGDSTDEDGEIVRYWWDWESDGFYEGITISPSAQYTYVFEGIYTATVMVEDDEGALTTASIQILVNETLPGPSSWWMFGHDYRHTRRSPFVGPQTDNVRWTYDTGQSIDSSPAIAADGTLYVGAANGVLYALNPNGSLKWTFTAGGSIYSSPALAADGTIYIGSNDGMLNAVNPDGTPAGGNWPYATGGHLYASPTVGPDGTIYTGSYDTYLHAVNPDGTVNWLYKTDGRIVSTAAIGADGTVYIGSQDNFVHAVLPGGIRKWAYDTGANVDSSAAIGTDGTVYFCCPPTRLYAFDPDDGSVVWDANLGANANMLSPAIGPAGAVVIGPEDSRSFYSYTPDGGRNWTILAQGAVKTSPAIDAAGTVYIGTLYGLVVYDRLGVRQWGVSAGGTDQSSPVIGADGTVYFVNAGGVVYAVGPNP